MGAADGSDKNVQANIIALYLTKIMSQARQGAVLTLMPEIASQSKMCTWLQTGSASGFHVLTWQHVAWGRTTCRSVNKAVMCAAHLHRPSPEGCFLVPSMNSMGPVLY